MAPRYATCLTLGIGNRTDVERQVLGERGHSRSASFHLERYR